MFAFGISCAILASREMCILTVKVGTAFSNPGNHTCTTELVAAIALRVTAGLLGFDGSIAVGAVSEGFLCLDLCFAVDGRNAGAVFGATLSVMFRPITVNADLEAAVSADEYTAILLAVERLSDLDASVHANDAVFELLGVSGHKRLAKSMIAAGRSRSK